MRRTSFDRLVPAAWKQGRVEEHSVALGERQLNMMLVEIVAKLRAACRHISGQVALRERQVERRARLERHVAMCDGSLKRQRRGEAVDVGGKALDLLRRLEAEVIVAVDDLGRAARVDDVELRGDLIRWAEPGFAHQG
jgi:hypothetical protein